MTRADRINEALALIADAAKRGEIEQLSKAELSSGWRVDNLPILNHSEFEYRAKPEPREFMVAWNQTDNTGTPRECPSGAVVLPYPAYGAHTFENYTNVVRVREVLDDE